jgi:RNA polymerase sigma-70 factor (ECF subfamily)
MVTPEHLEAHRAALTGHCYRMLGSAAEADDAVQETLVRAWRAAESFEGRSSVKTWLHRIATRVCLDALADPSRRARPMELSAAGTVDDPLVALPGERWLEPVPDAAVLPEDATPDERAILRESIRLAFVAALQHLAPRQRAALLLAEVLGWSAVEIAAALDTSVPAVNSALQRARAALASRVAAPGEAARDGALTPAQAALVRRFVAAFEAYDADALAALCHEDVTFSMPPYALWLRGPASVRAWLTGRGAGCQGSRLLATRACGAPAFGQYRARPGGGHHPWALAVLELRGDRIAGWTSFLDVGTLFPRFGLPAELPAPPAHVAPHAP